jgi:hypothetical protein
VNASYTCGNPEKARTVHPCCIERPAVESMSATTCPYQYVLSNGVPVSGTEKSVFASKGPASSPVAIAACGLIGGPLWLVLVHALAPDISTLASLAGTRGGSSRYDAFHTYLAPVTPGSHSSALLTSVSTASLATD